MSKFTTAILAFGFALAGSIGAATHASAAERSYNYVAGSTGASAQHAETGGSDQISTVVVPAHRSAKPAGGYAAGSTGAVARPAVAPGSAAVLSAAEARRNYVAGSTGAVRVPAYPLVAANPNEPGLNLP